MEERRCTTSSEGNNTRAHSAHIRRGIIIFWNLDTDRCFKASERQQTQMMDMCDLKRVNDGILIERKNTHSALLKPV